MNIQFLALVFLLCISQIAGSQTSKPADEPMSDDQIAVYNAFLTSYSKGRYINVFNKTIPITLPFGKDKCREGVDLTLFPSGSDDVHTFSPQAHIPSNVTLITLVDPYAPFAGYFLSEILFDKTHQRAILNYELWGYGKRKIRSDTKILEKIEGQWKLTHSCPRWIS